MDDRRLGRLVRASRIRKGLHQIDLERLTGVDQTTISLIERGASDHCTLHTIRLVAGGVGIPVELIPRIAPGEVSGLLDEGHAALVESLLRILRTNGWETVAEYTFSHYGERGSVDVLAWHAATRTLLLVEVKTLLLDCQEILATLDRKVRLVPGLVARERGWMAAVVGRLLLVEESLAARRVVATHRAIFDTAFPVRSRAARQWVGGPSGTMSALWFLSLTNGVRGTRRPGLVRRVRLVARPAR